VFILGFKFYKSDIKGELMNRKKAFTLIELLVVVAIIALLLSIITPSFRLAKEKAMNLLCQNNLRQYALTAEMYLTGNNDTYPRAWDSLFTERPAGWCQWHDEETFLDKRPDLAGPLWPYLDVQDVHLCPIFARVAKQHGKIHPAHSSSIPVTPQYSYSMNAALGPEGEDLENQQWPGIKRTEVRRPAETFFFSEENMWVTPGLNGFVLNDNALVVRWDLTLPYDTEPSHTDSFGFFHNSPNLKGYIYSEWDEIEDKDVGNVYAVFVDGHVDPVYSKDSYRFYRPQ
jgi:prepilin-type N-terminal cleavage/methylation domain-containing protein